MQKSLYRRPLPKMLVAFASDEGRALFREALGEGHLEGFFALAEQFHTQADPAFCGLASLVVVLNALGIDPGRLWKGPWRWYSEELLDCCAPLDRVRQRGVSLDELACLARCNGAGVRVTRADEQGPAELRASVREACASSKGSIAVVSYAREDLGQTGEGHFSPVGGYHAARDLVLLLDVARFKYPPHWVPLELLYRATQRADPATGRPRGWLVFTRKASPSALLFSVSARATAAEIVAMLHHRIPTRLRASGARDAKSAVGVFAAAVAELGPLVDEREALAPEHASAVEVVRCALRATDVHAVVAAGIPRARDSEMVTAIILATPEATWKAAGVEAAADLAAILERGRSSPVLAPEIAQLREQLVALSRIGPSSTEGASLDEAATIGSPVP
jgi:glutathione gamma-glutamylcysteinyltransferase